ncbi:MAG: hypothetical protein CL562_08730 [Alphaproteobacteria bacterium]|jgi:hypothetical protein|nr:hypothetical protein [Alphaproteobacteria bacterium]|tara:strand:+ start:517 stop:1023 length:507 start_codon:yes stop_codon:yes gene_type:complete
MSVQGINMRDEREQYMNIDSFKTDIPVLGPLSTQDITRGICRFLTAMDYTPLKEFKLSSGRRVDVMGLNSGGRFLLVEIKSSVADFKSDKKWREYRPFGDLMYFGVANGFPTEILPNSCGIIIADAYNGAVLKESPLLKINNSRRRSQLLKFARKAASRLNKVNDPRI